MTLTNGTAPIIMRDLNEGFLTLFSRMEKASDPFKLTQRC
jgi:hypothetical protein